MKKNKSQNKFIPVKAVFFMLTVFLYVVFFLRLILLMLPYPEYEEFKNKEYSLKITDRNGMILQVLPLEDGSRREFTPLEKIPRNIVNAFILSEDRRFFSHPGVDVFSMLRAVFQNISEGEIVSGASTITMQLARIISPHEQGFKGKIVEVLNSLRLEAKLSKPEILELWLNSIPFGFRAFGVTTAGKVFFGKDLGYLTDIESLLLSIIPRRPLEYSPSENTVKLKAAFFNLAERSGIYITEEDYENTIRTAIRNASEYSWPFNAPHFVNYMKTLITDNEKKHGLPLITSLDLELTETLQSVLSFAVESAEENRITNGSSIVIDNRTGEILAYVGSKDFFDEEHSGQIDGVQITNQPGSAIKPFLYGLALDKGFTPADILPDIPSDFGSGEIYTPMNFNRRFNGPVRLRTALSSSLNVPAVYLLERIGVYNFVEKLFALGFDSLRGYEEELGTGLALGNAEVSLYELVRAFAVFPRDGKKLDIVFRLGESGDIEDQVYSPAAAGLIRDILSDKVSRITGFGVSDILDISFPAMFKTGTSNQFNNIWALGATHQYTIGVWMGNFSGNTVIGRTGSSLPAEVVKRILVEISKEPEDFFPLTGVKEYEICPLSGGLATENCVSSIKEYIQVSLLPEKEPEPCSYHVKINNRIVIQYPPEYQNWAQDYSYSNIVQENSLQYGDDLYIVTPNNGSVFYFDTSIPREEQAVKIEVISDDREAVISVYINNNLYAESAAPLICYFPIERGTFNIDAYCKTLESHISFEVR